MPRLSLFGSLLLSALTVTVAGCGTSVPTAAVTHPPHRQHHTVPKTSSRSRHKAASHTAHHQSTGATSRKTTPSTGPTQAVAAFGSVAWSQTLQAQLAQILHAPSVAPLEIFPTSTTWGFPAHSVLILEPLAYHATFYYAVSQKGQSVVWQHFSNAITTIPSAVAAKVPAPLFWPMHFAMEMIQGVQESPALGDTIPWNTVAGNVSDPVAITGYYMQAMSGEPANLSISVFLPMHWAHPQDAGEAAYSLPDGHWVYYSVTGNVNSDTWQLDQSFHAVPPSQFLQQLPTDQQGDFLLPHSL